MIVGDQFTPPPIVCTGTYWSTKGVLVSYLYQSLATTYDLVCTGMRSETNRLYHQKPWTPTVQNEGTNPNPVLTISVTDFQALQ